MTDAGPAKVIANKPTEFGVPLQIWEHPSGSRIYLYGDCLPQTAQEQKAREREVARICKGILLHSANIQEAGPLPPNSPMDACRER